MPGEVSDGSAAVKVRTRLAAMLNAERRRDFVSLGNQIRDFGSSVENCGIGRVSSSYRALVQRSQAAFEFERSNGPRSLLDMTNPANRRWIEWGIIRLPEPG